MLADLIRRPWDTGEPAVTAHLHVTAPEAGRTAGYGEVNGQPITVAHVRVLLARLGALGRPEPAETHDPTAAQDASSAPVTGPAAPNCGQRTA